MPLSSTTALTGRTALGRPLKNSRQSRCEAKKYSVLSLNRAAYRCAGGDALPLTLTEAHLTSTYQPQLGDYLLVVTQWDVKTEEAEPDSLLLKYDAVTHEVRNHRAEVEWQTPAGDTRLMADFGFFHSAHGVRLDLSKARQAPAKQE